MCNDLARVIRGLDSSTFCEAIDGLKPLIDHHWRNLTCFLIFQSDKDEEIPINVTISKPNGHPSAIFGIITET